MDIRLRLEFLAFLAHLLHRYRLRHYRGSENGHGSEHSSHHGSEHLRHNGSGREFEHHLDVRVRGVDPLGAIVRPGEVEIKRILLEGISIHNFGVHLMIMDVESVQIVTSNFHPTTLVCQEDVSCANTGVLYFDVVIFTRPDCKGRLIRKREVFVAVSHNNRDT